MNELLTRLRDVLSGYMQEDKDGAFIEEFDSLLAKHDTSDVWKQFAIWMLVDPEHGVIKFAGSSSIQRDAIQRVAQLFIDDCKDAAEWNAAARDAYDLTHGIAGVVYNRPFYAFRAAGAAAYDYAVYAAASASSAFALHADWAAYAAFAFHAADVAFARDDYEDSAALAALAAFHAAALAAGYADAMEAHRETMADKLLELIKQAPEKT